MNIKLKIIQNLKHSSRQSFEISFNTLDPSDSKSPLINFFKSESSHQKQMVGVTITVYDSVRRRY